MTTDNGARLAAILPTGIAALAKGLGANPEQTLRSSLGLSEDTAARSRGIAEALPGLRSLILLVVDGLGYANLRASKGYARTLSALPTKRIETVIPSTTGAALTTLMTGRLPGEHGLIGYEIKHPELGLVNTLNQWQGITDPQSWQQSTALFAQATAAGARAIAIGRPAHATGGLTESILAGAEYRPGQTIDERFAIASQLVRGADPVLVYLYVDELDRAAHSEGWQSATWQRRLEDLDSAVDGLVRSMPSDVGLVVTADHGMVDIRPEHYIVMDGEMLEGVSEVGGEARMRSLYLNDPSSATEIADRLTLSLGKHAWVGTRNEAIAAGWFGPIRADIASRLGEVLVIARGSRAFSLSGDRSSHPMVGQHGGVSDEERGVPVALAGSLAGSSFVTQLAAVAQLRSPHAAVS